jgi:hypothetical protein
VLTSAGVISVEELLSIMNGKPLTI